MFHSGCRPTRVFVGERTRSVRSHDMLERAMHRIRIDVYVHAVIPHTGSSFVRASTIIDNTHTGLLKSVRFITANGRTSDTWRACALLKNSD